MKNNEPAFPSRTTTSLSREDGTRQTTMVEDGYRGITILDYFAVHAPTSELALGETEKWCAKKLGITEEEYRKDASLLYLKIQAMCRYEWARAMLEVRDASENQREGK